MLKWQKTRLIYITCSLTAHCRNPHCVTKEWHFFIASLKVRVLEQEFTVPTCEFNRRDILICTIVVSWLVHNLVAAGFPLVFHVVSITVPFAVTSAIIVNITPRLNRFQRLAFVFDAFVWLGGASHLCRWWENSVSRFFGWPILFPVCSRPTSRPHFRIGWMCLLDILVTSSFDSLPTRVRSSFHWPWNLIRMSIRCV